MKRKTGRPGDVTQVFHFIVRRQVSISTALICLFFLVSIPGYVQQAPVIQYGVKNYQFTKGVSVSGFTAPYTSGSSVPATVQGTILEAVGIGYYDASRMTSTYDGNVVSVRIDSGVIQKVNIGARLVQTVAANRDRPWGVVKDSQGNIYWVETGSSTIITNPDKDDESSLAGSYLDGMGKLPGPIGQAVQGVNAVREIYKKISGDDLIRAISGQDEPPPYILKFSGKIYKLAKGASTPEVWMDGVQMPTGLAIDKDDNLYVACFTAKYKVESGFKISTGGVEKLDGYDGTYAAKIIRVSPSKESFDIGPFPGLDYPGAVGVDDNYKVYVQYYTDNFTKTKVASVAKNEPGYPADQLYPKIRLLVDANELHEDMAVDGRGNVYLSDFMNDKIYVYPYNSTTLNQVLLFSDKVRAPKALYVDKASNQLWVKDGKYLNTGSFKKLSLFGFNITPALPEGLVLNSDGSISGTPKVTSPATSYTITASNENGYATDVVTIAVNQITNPALSYPVSSYTFPISSAISPIPAPVNSGGAFNQQKGPLKVETLYQGGTAIQGFAFDASGNYYFVQPDSGRIIKVTPSGASSVYLSGLNNPADIAIDNNSGYFYYSEKGGNRVGLIYPGFNTPIPFITMGTPAGLGIAGDGKLYVLNQGSGTVLQYNPRNNDLKDNFITGLYQPRNLCIYENQLYILGIDGVIKRIPINNPTAVTTIATVPDSWGMTMDDYGNIYVSGYGGIKKIAANTHTPQPFATSLDAYYVRAIKADNDNNFYISTGEFDKQHIIKLRPDGYTVTPALPDGLVLNDNGTISGTPTKLSTAKNYTVTATNSTGSGSAQLTIAIDNIPTNSFSYSTPLNLNRNIAMNEVAPSVSGGAPTGFTISPALPAGLQFDQATGKISGTPTVNQPATNYTITAINAAGGKSATVQIIITDLAPSNLVYSFPHSELMKDFFINTVVPKYNGSNATSFSISPSLPAGLQFNSSNGEISGTATVTSPNTQYTVTLHNGAGSTTAKFNLSVTPAPIPKITYATNEYVFTKGFPIPTIPAPVNTGFAFPQQRIRDTAILGLAGATGVVMDADGNTYIAYNGGIKKLPRGSKQMEDYITSGINNPVDLVVDKNGNMYVSQGGSSTIKKIVLNTRAVSNFVTSGLGNVQGLFMSKDNDLYAVDYSNRKVVKYTNCVASAISDVLSGLDDQFNYGTQPYDFAMDTLGNRYILLCGYPSHGAGTLNNVFAFIYKYPASGGPRELVNSMVNQYNYIIVDKAGNLYVSCTKGGIARINTFNNSGNGSINSYLDLMSLTVTSYGLALDADENVIYAINSTDASRGGIGLSYQFGYNVNTLPAGLSLHSDGTITGIPSALQSSTEHIVSASSFYGKSNAPLKITVVDVKPAFSYGASHQALIRNTTVVNLKPVHTGGPVGSYTITPNRLPDGLHFNGNNGIITGTPTKFVDTATTYIISASNTGGTARDTLVISIVDVPPTSLAYSTNNVVYINKAFSDIKPTVTGGGPVTRYSVSPELPAGIHLNPSTGVISGSPLATQPATTYTISAENSGGAATATMQIAVNDIPPYITYVPDTTFKFQQNVTIAGIPAPANSGGPIQNLSISGLPAGLQFNADGSITGKPTQLQAATRYRVIADGGVWGKDTTYLNIEVVPLPPDSFRYNTPITVLKGSAMQMQAPIKTTTGGGAISLYSIEPMLPPGLHFDEVNGIISGTPTVLLNTDGQIYTVTGSNGAGEVSTMFLLRVKDVPPVISYKTDNVFTINQTATINVTSSGGLVKKYSISPELPQGMVLDSVTGNISGKPTLLLPRTRFTITGRNFDNPASNVDIYITVVDVKPVINYPTPHSFTKTVAISAIQPASTGGAVVQYSIDPALPQGLSIDSLTGIISGTPTAGANAKNYNITATNSGGSHTVSINLAVINKKPAIGYSTSHVFTKGVKITGVEPVSTGGDELVYTITPGLPSGLSLDSQTGIISGSPTDTTAQVNYTITATNNGGNDQAVISLKVNDKAPAAFRYLIDSVLYVGYSIGNIAPDMEEGGGSIVRYGVSPAVLPAGLSFNTSTGVISGTPSGEFDPVTFTVTAYNSGGTSSTQLSLEVMALDATITKTDVNCYGLADGTATVTVTGGKLPIRYSWSQVGSTEATVTGLAAGTYICTITDATNKSIQRQVIINQPPQAVVNGIENLAVCVNGTTPTINFSGQHVTHYAWTNDNTSIGLAASGTGNIPAFVVVNKGNTIATATITVTAMSGECVGATESFTISVKPEVTVTQPEDKVWCNDAITEAVSFSGFAEATSYSWTNSNPAIGLAASGTGAIAAFTAVNKGTTAVTATITVTPAANGCTGLSKTFTITINPTPTVNALSDQSVCDNAGTAAIQFSGAVSNTTFTWTNDNSSIGLAEYGEGNIASFTGNNKGTRIVTGHIMVRPEANGCVGAEASFDIAVRPLPVLSAISNQELCNQAHTEAVTFHNNMNDTHFAWANSNTSIGLSETGVGNISRFAAINNGTTPLMATITVTPTADGCTGLTKDFDITVNPTPTVNAIDDQSVCNTSSTTAVLFSGAVSHTSFTWTNSNNSIGLSPSGEGDISAFTAVNTGVEIETGHIKVTPWANGCVGVTETFNIAVRPSPIMDVINDQVLCNQAHTEAVVFSSNLVETRFTWVNNNSGIGLDESGEGDINSFTVLNKSNARVNEALITVLPEADGCTGPTQSFEIKVNPTPVVKLHSPLEELTPTGTTRILAVTTTTMEGDYTWFKDGRLYDATGRELQNIKIDDIGTYKVVHSDANGCVSDVSAALIISAKQPEVPKLLTFPNPSTGKFNLRVSEVPNNAFVITVVNSNGNQVYVRRVATVRSYEAIELDLSTVINGTYRVIVADSTGKVIGIQPVLIIR